LEETRPNHAISSVVTATKLPVLYIILKRRGLRIRRKTKRRNTIYLLYI